MRSIPFSKGLSFPIELVTQRIAALARTGAGKTYAAGKIVEGLLKLGVQVIIIDPVGVWWGLRLAADGKSPGIHIPVFGGNRGDIPLDPSSGALIADLIVDRGISAVLDTSSLRKGGHKKFVADFAEQFFHRKKNQRSPTPVHVVLEEAQKVIPQRMIKGDERMVGAVEDLVRLGRNYGIGVTMISQRPQSINKDSLNQAECLIVLQITGPQEKKAIQRWIAEKAAIKDAAIDHISELPVGEAWVWSPQWLRMFKKVKVGKKWTYDASKTPVFGSRRQKVRELAKLDIDQLRKDMAVTIEKAEKVNPKFLQAKIKKLEVELARSIKTKVRTAAFETKTVEVPVLGKKGERQLKAAVDQVNKSKQHSEVVLKEAEMCLGQMKRANELLGETIVGLRKMSEKVAGSPPATSKVPAVGRATRLDPKDFRHPPELLSQLSPQSNGLNLKKGARRILDTLARWHPGRLTRSQLATLSKFKSRKSGTYTSYLSNIRKLGLIEESGNEVWLSFEGTKVSDIGALPQTPDEIIAHWRGVLKEGARRMLDILIADYPNKISRDGLAVAAGFTTSQSGTFSSYLSNLYRNGLIEKDGKDLRASDTLFMETAPQ